MENSRVEDWRILHVDDDEDDFILARAMLAQAQGRKVTLDWAPRLEEARERLAANQYDAVLVDYDMGADTGIDLIRELAPSYPAPFILFTGRGSYEIDVEAMQAGATLYLTKNEANPLLLERFIRYAIEIKQKERDLREIANDLRVQEDALRASEQRLDDFLESTHDTFYALDRDWRIIYANRRYAEVVGMQPDDLIGKNFWEVFPRYLGTQVEEYYRRVMTERTPVHYRSNRFYSQSIYDISVYPIREGLAVFATDRTEEHRNQQALLDREAELRASEEQLRSVIENLPVGLIVLDPTGKTLHWNKAALEMYGYLSQEDELAFLHKLVGRYELFTLEGQALSFEDWPTRRLLDGVIFQDRQLMIRRKDCDWQRVFSYSGVPVRVGGHSVMGLLTVRDVTHEKQVERELHRALDEAQDSRSILEAMMEYIPEGITIAEGQDAVIRMVSRYGQELLGSAHDQMTAEQVAAEWQVFQTDGVTPLPVEELPVMRAIHRGEIVKNQDLIQVNQAGQSLYLSCSAGPIRDAEGKITGGVVAWREISERKQAEEALRHSIERERAHAAEMEILMDTVPAMIWISHDPACREMIGNRYGYEFLQMWQGANISKTASEEDIQLQPYRNFKNGKEIPTEEMPMQVAAATGVPAVNYDFDLVFNDGAVRTVLGNVTPLFNEKGNPSGAIAVFMDITDRRKVEEKLKGYAAELERSNRALQDFAFIASHDLQEPLRKVQAFGHMLETRFSDELGVEGKDYIARMTSAASRMKVMIEGLLTFSRVTSQAQPFESVDLNTVAGEVLSDLEVRLMQTGGRVEVGELPTLEADPLQIRQVLQNLIGNALKYHRPDVPPVVSVTGQVLPGDTIEIRVQDNGIGFEMQDAGRLFAPFTRLNRRPGYEGSGMGLAICKKIVDRHGGKIHAESTPGEGSVFIVTLPQKQ